ncbi:hypothetical protein MPL3365_10290 [Mesorhizobium plurifarium]|uniref:Uncharacterized protein n=1 Tax=Mesorhizobium plurifarium TaxID=69974 RepID=A0A090GSA5_MESPL|nr:hypothetical protein MPL3365_10290 [Mesorhizobium plurifarium]
MLGIGHTFALEQPLCGRAITAHHPRIDRHIYHRSAILPAHVALQLCENDMHQNNKLSTI